MGNCNSCGCTDKNEVSTFEVQVGTSSNVGLNNNTGTGSGGSNRNNGYQNKTKS